MVESGRSIQWFLTGADFEFCKENAIIIILQIVRPVLGVFVSSVCCVCVCGTPQRDHLKEQRGKCGRSQTQATSSFTNPFRGKRSTCCLCVPVASRVVCLGSSANPARALGRLLRVD